MTIRDLKQSNKVNIMIEYLNGTKYWYQNGELHRDNDLPAIEFENGSKEYFQNGNLHRDNDLPAIDNVNGYKAWFKNGIEYFPNKTK